jgi:CheY-like chemotaxis protein
MKILIVDDDARLLKVLSETLESTGKYEVCAVGDSLQAINVARNFLPDIAILDIQMPGISGREIALQLRQNVLTRNVVVVFLTSLLRKKGQTLKKDVDGCQVLGKPATLDEIKQAIDGAIEHRNKNKVCTPNNIP